MLDKTPPLHDWLQMPRQEIAAIVRKHRLTVLMDNDGTRRHYLLHRLREGQPAALDDFEDYSRFSGQAHIRLYGLLFDLGVTDIVTPFLIHEHFKRGLAYVTRLAQISHQMLTRDAFLDFYTQQGVTARIHGSYDVMPVDETIRHLIDDTAQELETVASSGEKYLHYGYYTGTYEEEMIARTVQLYEQHGRAPSEAELRAACFPERLQEANLMITAGALRTGHMLHPLLDNGNTNLYSLGYLLMDTQEETLRRIIYDHLFRRRSTAFYMTRQYDEATLRELETYYDQHVGDFVGEGHLVEPGIWYPNTPD